jgi:hypothetical protein
VAAIALAIADAGRGRPLDPARLRPAASGALLLQLAHCTEEYLTGFAQRFPVALGLMPWSNRFFLTFNASWLLVWALAVGALVSGRTPLAARAVLWFLALAGVLNAAAHPLLALRAGGYFPGLVTALPLGIAGGVLAARLSGR